MSVTLELFRNETDVEQFAAGETIFREGDRGDDMFVVLEGTVELSAHGQRVEVLGPGSVMGEMALIDRGRAPPPRWRRPPAGLPASRKSASFSWCAKPRTSPCR
jgi:CRP-like cAMP-binding protein